MANVENVTAGKPKTGGALSVAPLGTALPTDATTALNAAFVNLGYISEDGLTNSNSRESDEIKAWGGDTVLSLQTDYTDTFTFTLLETLKEDVMKLAFGSANVTGTLAAGVTVKANPDELDEQCMVVDMITRGGGLKRVVIPRGKVTELGDITYVDNDPVGYELTVTAFPDAEGNTHYEYVKSA